MSQKQLVPVNLYTAATDPTIPTLSAGDMYYNTSTGVRIYNGSSWGTASSNIPVQINAQVATYTAILADAYKLITMNVGAANDFNIPTNSVAYAVGTVLNVIQIGSGQTTIKALTPGTTTVLSTGGTAASPKLRVQYSSATCIKVATETWYVIGDIS